MKNISESDIANAIDSTLSMAEAAAKCNIHYNTFISYAKKYGLYRPNQGGRGIKKKRIEGVGKIFLEEILNGLHPTYQTFKLKNRLFEAGLKKNECEVCGVSEWNGSPLNCELDHIDGNSRNHELSNLRILCPNCHSQTDTFRAKNKK